jgi:predicted ATP-dependent protease
VGFGHRRELHAERGEQRLHRATHLLAMLQRARGMEGHRIGRQLRTFDHGADVVRTAGQELGQVAGEGHDALRLARVRRIVAQQMPCSP